MTTRAAEYGVVFDFDGVLADTELIHLAAYQEVFKPRGWRLDRNDYFSRYLGYDDRDLLRLYASDRGLAVTKDDLDMVLKEKTAAYERVILTQNVLYPAAAETARAIAERFPLAIASGSRRVEILAILGASGLGDLFTAVVSADDTSKSKPAPDPYLAAAAALGLSPSACVAIEDSHWGLDAARTAGMRTIAITTTSPASRLSAADRIVNAIDAVTVALIESVLSANPTGGDVVDGRPS